MHKKKKNRTANNKNKTKEDSERDPKSRIQTRSGKTVGGIITSQVDEIERMTETHTKSQMNNTLKKKYRV